MQVEMNEEENYLNGSLLVNRQSSTYEENPTRARKDKGGKLPLAVEVFLGVAIGASWALAAVFTGDLEQTYAQPYFLTYVHATTTGGFCLLLYVGLALHGRYSTPAPATLDGTENKPWTARNYPDMVKGLKNILVIVIFAILDFLSNFLFILALTLTTASSGLSLEQATAIYIAVISAVLLNEKFSALKVFGMVVAIGGAVVVVQADDASAGAKNALLGDVLVLLGTSTCAAVYMVYFRIKFPDMLPADLLGFFIAKNVVFMIIFLPGFWILDAIGFELFRWPNAGEWGMIWVVGACSVVFNITLNWSTLKISPLHARLSILVGLPISFVFDAVTGTFSSLRLLGVSLVVAGLVLYFAFEAKVDEPESGAEAETEALQSKKPQRKAVDVV